MARYGMLECVRNFKGTVEFQCKSCNVIDDEEHRLNHCILFKDLNFRDCTEKIPFNSTFFDGYCLIEKKYCTNFPSMECKDRTWFYEYLTLLSLYPLYLFSRPSFDHCTPVQLINNELLLLR